MLLLPTKQKVQIKSEEEKYSPGATFIIFLTLKKEIL